MRMLLVLLSLCLILPPAHAQYSSDPEKDPQHQLDEKLAPDVPGPPEVDDSAGPGPIVATPGKVTLETVPAMTVIVLPMTGSYEQHPKAMEKLMTYVGPKGIVQGPPFGIYYSDPSQVPPDSLVWEVGVPVPAGTKADPPFIARDMGAMQGATVICTGPYEQTEACFGALFDWAAQNGYSIVGPAQEHWLSDAQTVKPEKRETKIIFPVAKPAK